MSSSLATCSPIANRYGFAHPIPHASNRAGIGRACSADSMSRAMAQSSDSPTSAPALADPAVAAVAPSTASPDPPRAAADEAGEPRDYVQRRRPNAIPTRNLFSIVREGGLAMLPLLVCSFMMLVFVFERTISLRRGRVVPGPFVTRFLQQLKEGQLDRDGAIKVCQENGSPVARVFCRGGEEMGPARRWKSSRRSSTPANGSSTNCGVTCASSTASPRSDRCSACWAPSAA